MWLVLLLALTRYRLRDFLDDPSDGTTSPLNWIGIHYYNANREPDSTGTVRVNGRGFVR